MNRFAALLGKETRALFTSSVAYVVLTAFLLIMGYSFSLTLFLTHTPSLVHVFFQIYVLFLLTVPVITMRTLAEERRQRTLELLLTAPVTEAQVVAAKYLASLGLIALMLALSSVYALLLGLLGAPEWGPIVSGYVGLLLLGAGLVGVGVFTSALAANQVVAALVSLSLFLLFWIIDQFGYLLPDPYNALVTNLSLSVHFKPFATGSVYLSDAGFFISMALLGNLLAVRALGRR